MQRGSGWTGYLGDGFYVYVLDGRDFAAVSVNL